MADTFARMRQLIGSTAEWAANNIVLGYGEIGIERISTTNYKAKIGDGTSKWSLLPYLSADDTVVNPAMQAALNTKLALAGGTMTGDLILAHDGTKAMEPITVTQFNSESSKQTAAVNDKVSRSGDTMTGPLMLSREAIQSFEAVTFEQLNKAITGVSSVTNGALQFAGTLDLTTAFATPVPPQKNGEFYTVSAAGAVDPSWAAHLVNKSLTSVAIGDYLIWDGTKNLFHHVNNSVTLSQYVPLAGTNAMVGDIIWGGAAGNKVGQFIISGKGGTIDDAVIDNGTY